MVGVVISAAVLVSGIVVGILMSVLWSVLIAVAGLACFMLFARARYYERQLRGGRARRAKLGLPPPSSLN